MSDEIKDEKKVAALGQTVYLSENESFEDIDVIESAMKKELPPVISAKIEKVERPIPGKPIVEVEEEVEEEKPSLKEIFDEKVKELMEKVEDEVILAEDRPLEFDNDDFEKEIKINLDEIEEDFVTQDIIEEEEVEVPRKKAKVVDISTISVTNKTELDKERDLKNALYGNKGAFQIVAAQSGYMAKVLPLVHKDVVNILYSTLGRYEYKKGVYRVIWEKIYDTSVGRMDFDTWLKVTSVEDMETFYYGVYCSTFPNSGTFKYKCPECGAEREYKIRHDNLIKTTDAQKMRALMDEVSKNATSIEAMKKYSLIGKNQAIQLSESNLIVELRTPTLFDSLEILRTVPEQTIDKDTLSVTNMLYVKRILIPSKQDSTVFTEELNRQAILRVIDNLPIDDAKELEDAVYDRVDENRIMYSIKTIKCAECGEEVHDIPVSIEDILFTLIFEKTQ